MQHNHSRWLHLHLHNVNVAAACNTDGLLHRCDVENAWFICICKDMIADVGVERSVHSFAEHQVVLLWTAV